MPLPCSPTPAGSTTPGHYGVPTWPPLCAKRRRPTTQTHFGAQSQGFDTRCLRFAGRVTPPRRQTRFRLPARLCRTGLATRRVPPKGFRAASYMLVLLSQACVTQAHCAAPRLPERLEAPSSLSPSMTSQGATGGPARVTRAAAARQARRPRFPPTPAAPAPLPPASRRERRAPRPAWHPSPPSPSPR